METLAEHPGDNHAERCRMLWVSVLLCAIADKDHSYFYTPHARTVCALAGYDPTFAFRIADKLRKDNAPRPAPTRRPREPKVFPVDESLKDLVTKLQKLDADRDTVNAAIRKAGYTVGPSYPRPPTTQRHFARILKRGGLSDMIDWYKELS